MKLVYALYEIAMELKENSGHYLCIEQPKAYAEIISNLYQQCNGGEGGAIISDGTKALSLSKQAVMIVEPFSLQFDTRKINTQLFKELEEIAQDGYYMDYLELQGHLKQFMERLMGEVPYPLNYDEEATIQGLCKWLNVHIDDSSASLAERVSNYLELMAQLCQTKVAFLVGSENYLTREERQALQKMANYLKIYIVYITNHLDMLAASDSYCVIDADYCIITNGEESL